MQTIHYGQSEFDTADAIASAVFDYAEALATRRRYAVVDIPTVTSSGVANARLLLGPGIPLASVARLVTVGQEASRDEFGGGMAGSDANAIGDLVVHRTVRDLADGLHGLREVASAPPLDELLADEIAERGSH